MKKYLINHVRLLAAAALLAGGSACTDEIGPEGAVHDNTLPIELCGDIDQEYVSRASDAGFADGDRMGIFIVDYENDAPGTPSLSGNRASNAIFTLSEYKWSPNRPIYWKDKTTHIDVYGYYPFDNSMLSFSDHAFTVETDQSIPADAGSMSHYEKSDFLWAKQTDVAPTDQQIMLNYTHRMAGVKITITKGDGFVGDEWEKVTKIVAIDNTRRSAAINLHDGSVTPVGEKDRSIVAAPQGEGVYRAVVVPQTVEAGATAVTLTIDGTAYSYTPGEPVKYQQGRITAFTLKVNKKDTGQYSVVLVNMSIEKWENDTSSHNFEAAAYTVVDCPREGQLGACLEATGKQVADIRNLKITGRLNGDDFRYIREHIPLLAAINLHETVPVVKYGYSNEYLENTLYEQVLPDYALYNMKSLARVVLPKDLIVLGSHSLNGIGLAYNSTLVIPQTVTILEEDCLSNIDHGNLVMPDNLIYIGDEAMYYNSCHWEYNLGNSVKYIGESAFQNLYILTNNCTGCFKVPERLEYLGKGAFAYFGNNLTGEIRIPETLTKIPESAFYGMGFARGINLILHDDITEIGPSAFFNQTFNNTIIWPANLKELGSSSFFRCTFKGGFSPFNPNVLIGKNVFAYCKSMPLVIEMPEMTSILSQDIFTFSDVNDIVLPEYVEFIGESVFESSNLNSVKIGRFVERIGNEAFRVCRNLTSIVCMAPEPPELGDDVFLGLDYDHLILEVPERSVEKYRKAEGWNKIKFITAHHELSLSKGEILCLGKGVSQKLLVRSEGGWTVTECPGWCHLSVTSSNIRATEIEVSVDASTEAREGIIRFRLNDADYTAELKISQLSSEYSEDEEIVLQRASAGFNPVPIFIVGDGFDAYSVADGTYMETINEQIEHFFAIEPFKTYRNYFSVSTAIAVSPQKGIGNVEQVKETRFGTVIDPYGGLTCNHPSLREYVSRVSGGNNNLNNALIMVVANLDAFIGSVSIDDYGPTIALTALSNDPYPHDARGLVQHYAGGSGFGRLADEHVEHFDFIQACTCPSCKGIQEYYLGAAKGWYRNVSLTSSMSSVPWSHLVYDSRYSDIVDIFEGAYRHSRGAYRSESQSCMSTFIPYFNTISRETIVRRIMELSGDTFDFERFVAKDSRDGMPSQSE